MTAMTAMTTTPDIHDFFLTITTALNETAEGRVADIAEARVALARLYTAAIRSEAAPPAPAPVAPPAPTAPEGVTLRGTPVKYGAGWGVAIDEDSCELTDAAVGLESVVRPLKGDRIFITARNGKCWVARLASDAKWINGRLVAATGRA